MGCAPEEVVIRNDVVSKRGGPQPEAIVVAPKDETTVAGRVEGQILRGSVQQKRKDEGPKEFLSFEEAVVAAIDFHGALSGSGSYAPPPEARGGKHKGAGVGRSPAYSYAAQVAEVSVDTETGQVTGHTGWAAHDCGAKKIDMTEHVDPAAPTKFREHGGATWHKGRGPARHELDPARLLKHPEP